MVLSPCDRRRTRKVSGSCRSIAKSKIRRRRRRLQPDWANILCHILEGAQKKLSLAYTLTCRAVCSRWRSITLSHLTSSLNPPAAAATKQPPLMIWHAQSQHYFYWFLDIARPGYQLYQLSHRSEQLLRGGPMGHLSGYSYGWFVFSDTKNTSCLCLFHPLLFSGSAIRLPPIVPLKGFPPILNPRRKYRNDIDKAVLWGDPLSSNGNYGIAVIHPSYRQILFAKAGAHQFDDVEPHDFDEDMPYRWQDIILFRNCIYGVTLSSDGQHHHMEAWDCGDAGPRKVLNFQPRFSRSKKYRITLHLVESEGELLLVSIKTPDRRKLCEMKRESDTWVPFPQMFVLARSPDTIRVYKMDFEKMEWVEMDSLGDRVLFIMKHRNISVSTKEFPQYGRNTVYFDHYLDVGCTGYCVGVFNMEDGSMNEIWPEWN